MKNEEINKIEQNKEKNEQENNLLDFNEKLRKDLKELRVIELQKRENPQSLIIQKLLEIRKDAKEKEVKKTVSDINKEKFWKERTSEFSPEQSLQKDLCNCEEQQNNKLLEENENLNSQQIEPLEENENLNSQQIELKSSFSPEISSPQLRKTSFSSIFKAGLVVTTFIYLLWLFITKKNLVWFEKS